MAKITVKEARDLLELSEDDSLPEVASELFLNWINWINIFAYNVFSRLNSEDYISGQTYNIVSGTAAYAKPTDFKREITGKTGLYETTTGSIYQLLKYDAETVAFTVGATLTGATSAATGVISEVIDNGTTGYVVLTSVSGTFQDDETITDGSGGSATSNGAAEAFIQTENRVEETGFASPLVGYWLSGSNINITPQSSTNSTIYVFRYIPKLTKLDDDDDDTVFDNDDEGEQMLNDMLVLYYEQWASSGAGSKVNIADAQFIRSMNQVITNKVSTPKIYTIG